MRHPFAGLYTLRNFQQFSSICKKIAPGWSVSRHYRANMSNQTSRTEPIVALQRLTDPTVQGSMQSDAELLTLYVESGNRAAIEALILRYAGMVASVCRATVADSTSAEDAFQATFLVLLKSAKKIQKRRSVAAWLHGVAYRTACRVRKQRLVLVTEQSPAQVIALHEPEDDPIDVLARKLELEALDQELERLPQGVRAILVEHYLLGYTAPQIAERTSLSVAAVEGRIRRGRYTLLRQLAKRGVSLTVLVAASGWFQQHLQATEADDWAGNFLESYLPKPAPAAEQENNAPHRNTADIKSNLQSIWEPHSNVSSLVRGEMNMYNSALIKSAVSGSAVLLVGTLLSFNLFGDGDRPSAGTTQSTEAGISIPHLPAEMSTVVAQLGNAAPPSNRATQAQSTSEGAVATTDKTIELRHAQTTETPAKSGSPIEWQKPEGAPPAWLQAGSVELEQSELELRDVVRARLNEKFVVDFNGVPLSTAVLEVSEMSKLTMLVDAAELNAIGCDPDTPIKVSGQMSVREFLRRAFRIAETNGGLAYTVQENGLEITSAEAANRCPAIRYYDLSYVLPNDSHLPSVMNAIMQTVEPDTWAQAGGTNTISPVGSMLIIACGEPAHQKIEVMLSKVAAINKMNLEKESTRSTPAIPMGSGMGGGGLGGGMF